MLGLARPGEEQWVRLGLLDMPEPIVKPRIAHRQLCHEVTPFESDLAVSHRDNAGPDSRLCGH